MGSTLMDDVECGNFLDQIDYLIDFPPDNECGSGLICSGDSKTIPSIWDGALQDAGKCFPGCNGNSAADLSADLAIPYEDFLQLEWLSTFVEDSFSGGGMTLTKDIVKKEPSQKPFVSSSPVSVLESSSNSNSCSSEVKAIQHARSKRPRPATFCPCKAVQLRSPNSTCENHLTVVHGMSSESESVGESEHAKEEDHKPQVIKGKKKKIKLKIPLGPVEINQKTGTQAAMQCQHCGISKTPQWRGGPMGPKTLCNACGVRHTSGRLFPEYRPAASPTFVPFLHSNSHRKVTELRKKVAEENSVQGTKGPVSIGRWYNIIPDIKNR